MKVELGRTRPLDKGPKVSLATTALAYVIKRVLHIIDSLTLI